MEEHKSYKPDFTINYGGKEIYLEYFGLNDPKYNKINDIANKDIYLEKECAYKCKYFLIKKIK